MLCLYSKLIGVHGGPRNKAFPVYTIMRFLSRLLYHKTVSKDMSVYAYVNTCVNICICMICNLEALRQWNAHSTKTQSCVRRMLVIRAHVKRPLHPEP